MLRLLEAVLLLGELPSRVATGLRRETLLRKLAINWQAPL